MSKAVQKFKISSFIKRSSLEHILFGHINSELMNSKTLDSAITSFLKRYCIVFDDFDEEERYKAALKRTYYRMTSDYINEPLF